MSITKRQAFEILFEPDMGWRDVEQVDLAFAEFMHANSVEADRRKPEHSERAIYEAQAREDRRADLAGEKPHLISRMEDICKACGCATIADHEPFCAQWCGSKCAR